MAKEAFCYLERPVDHPKVHPYRGKYRFALSPKTVTEVSEQVDLSDRIDVDFYRKWQRRRRKSLKIKKKDPDSIDFGRDFDPPLYDHQKVGLALSLYLPAYGLFMEPGTGKTRIALHASEMRLTAGKCDKILVIAPWTILKQSWYAQLKEFTDLNGVVVHPKAGKWRWECPYCDKKWTQVSDNHAKNHYEEFDKLRKNTQKEDLMELADDELEWNDYDSPADKLQNSDFDVYMTSPGMVRSKTQDFVEAGFDFVILDESTLIKNATANRTKAIHRLGAQADYRLALTGTPITNSLEDIWSQMFFLDRSLDLNITKFRERYMQQHHSNPNIRWPRSGAKEEVMEKIKYSSVRVTREECLDLPERHVVNKKVDESKDIEKQYENMVDHLFALVDDEEVVAQNLLVQLLKLQQITNGFVKKDDEIIEIESNPPKLRELESIVEGVDGKVIVWAIFRKDFEKIQEKLDDYNPVCLYGDTDDADAVVEQFKEDDDTKILVAHPKSAKFGHTWTWADTTVFYSYSHSVEDFIQARNRNYRAGTERPVTEFRLIGSPIDSKILKSIKNDKDFGDDIVNSEDMKSLIGDIK